jgi:hypothetical protein
MQVDAWLGALFAAQFIHDGPILRRGQAVHVQCRQTVMRSSLPVEFDAPTTRVVERVNTSYGTRWHYGEVARARSTDSR